MELPDQRKWPLARGQALRLGQTLRAARQALGISMTAAAEAAQISRVTWHRLEKGEPTVALGLMLAAARVLELDLHLQPFQASTGGAADALAGKSLPLQIRLEDYPQLRQLAWQVGDGRQTLTPREALGLYERNWRHVQAELLEPREQALLDGLREVFGGQQLRV